MNRPPPASPPVAGANPPAPPRLDDPRVLFGWCMYDWANSAYATTVLAGLLPAYFAEAVVGADGAVVGGVWFSADSLWGFAVSAATFLAFLLSPILGAVADFSAAKKRFLLAFAYTGSLFTILLSFCRSGDVIQTLTFFVISQFAFVAANVFYDAFLPQIVTDDRLDRVSVRGYAFGYVGGGLQFALALGLIVGHQRLGLTPAAAARLGLASAGLWWAGFTLFAAFRLRDSGPPALLSPRFQPWPRPLAYATVGVARTLSTLRRARRYRHLGLFLLAFMLYDDGIQTVINMATIYGKVELKLPTAKLMLTLLTIQAVGAAGAPLFGRLASRLGAKRTIMLTLLLWSGVVIYAFFIRSFAQYFALGVVVGLVLGGSQALSRSFYSSLIPPQSSAEFFGFYTVFSKFSAIWGPLVFGVVNKLTGSSRLSIVSLIVFFLGGLALLAIVDENKARQARDAA